MYRQNGNAVNTYRKFSRVGCEGMIFGAKVSAPGFSEAEIIQMSGLTVKIARIAVKQKSNAGPKRRKGLREPEVEPRAKSSSFFGADSRSRVALVGMRRKPSG